jgi:membrane protease YdiL (CAAX protease family)
VSSQRLLRTLNRLSSPQNPWNESGAALPPEFPAATQPKSADSPPWSGWDVLQLAILTLASIFVFLLVCAATAQRLLYPGLGFVEVVRYPLVTVVAQLLAYVVVFLFMVAVVKRVPGQRFWSVIGWNWPKSWSSYLFAGVVLSVVLQAVAHFLPMPRELPIDRFFQTAQEAWVLSIFGVTLAPLMEELFFRGFLYPVLVRRLGVGVAVVLTSVGFGLIHAPQLGGQCWWCFWWDWR